MTTNHKDDILEQLRQGVTKLTESQEWIRWLDVQRRFHRYSWGNCLLISIQRPDATQVAGYRRWQDLGRQVRKGERGIFILAPVVNRTKVVVEDHEGGEESTDAHSVRAFRAACVFDVAQTDGDELPEVAARLNGDDPHQAFGQLVDIATGIGYRVELTSLPGQRNGDCNFLEQRLRVREGLTPAQMVKTLAHELAHALLHNPMHDHLVVDRDIAELEAESVAYVVCSGLDIDSGSYSFGYIAGWAGGGEIASKKISESAARINSAHRTIVGGLEDPFVLSAYQRSVAGELRHSKAQTVNDQVR